MKTFIELAQDEVMRVFNVPLEKAEVFSSRAENGGYEAYAGVESDGESGEGETEAAAVMDAIIHLIRRSSKETQ